ncbi:MAG: TetR/AcrR family transcriptional regulator [Bacteroidota bacterium]
MKKKEEPWILSGHKIFAECGLSAITVEGLAREVGKNKSSFYHYFVDLEIFIDRLLDYHFERSMMILEEEKKCKAINPDLFEVLTKYKHDVLFHRQILMNRSIPEFEELYSKITDQGVNAILKIWNKELNFSSHSNTGRRLLRMGIENLFQSATLNNLTIIDLQNSFNELKEIAIELRNPSLID